MKKIVGFGFLVDAVTSGIGLGLFSCGYQALGPTARGKFFDEVFSENRLKSESLISISGSEVS